MTTEFFLLIFVSVFVFFVSHDLCRAIGLAWKDIDAFGSKSDKRVLRAGMLYSSTCITAVAVVLIAQPPYALSLLMPIAVVGFCFKILTTKLNVMYDDTQSEWLYSKGWSDPEQLEIIAVRTESIGWTFGDLWKRWRGDTSYIYLEEVMKKDKTVILFVHLFYGLISILCFGFLITSSLVRTFAYDHWSRIEQHLNGLRHDEVVAFK